jgi:hypothetical protein
MNGSVMFRCALCLTGAIFDEFNESGERPAITGPER